VQIIFVKLKNKKIIQNTTINARTTSTDDENSLAEFYKHILAFFLQLQPNVNSPEEVAKLESIGLLQTALMSFIRNSALFFSSNVTDLTPATRITSNPDDLNENFTPIMKFLGFLDIRNESIKSLVDFWLSTITDSKLRRAHNRLPTQSQQIDQTHQNWSSPTIYSQSIQERDHQSPVSVKEGRFWLDLGPF